VLTKKMVIGHVMRYPGEVVELPPFDSGLSPSAQDAQAVEKAANVDADEATVPAPLRRRKKSAP
jgi:hypothetical protein